MSLENMMEPTGEMAPEQISAIKRSIEIGSLLVNDHPEIAELYRDGMTHPGIAEILDVKGKYDISSDKVAETSIHYAIKGHAGGFGTESYDGLISDLDELAGLEYEHHANGGRKTAELGLGVHAINPETGLSYRAEGGRKSAELGLGVHAINPETGLSYRAEGGKIGGRKTAELGLGIHAQTPEQRLEYGIIGGRKSAELGLGAHGINPETGLSYRAEGGRKAAEKGTGIHGYNPETGLSYRAEGGRKAAEKGTGIHGYNPETGLSYRAEGGRKAAELGLGIHSLQTPWGEEETGYAHLLSLDPEFQHQKGPNKGKGDYKTIAQVLNEDYHNGEDVRNANAVKINLFNYKKSLGN
jgi:hypothetical protein